MDVCELIREIKNQPDFAEHVGMILIHNGVVRSWSRQDRSPVDRIMVTPDFDRIEALRREYEQKPGIFKILVQAFSGELKLGDDLLYIVVAGDIRENVKPVLSDLLDRIKAEAVTKEEIKP
ncbi:MAG: molybdenum cofactor biosynthesis protein MoaE [Desulfovibrionales bacterium]